MVPLWWEACCNLKAANRVQIEYTYNWLDATMIVTHNEWSLINEWFLPLRMKSVCTMCDAFNLKMGELSEVCSKFVKSNPKRPRHRWQCFSLLDVRMLLMIWKWAMQHNSLMLHVAVVTCHVISGIFSLCRDTIFGERINFHAHRTPGNNDKYLTHRRRHSPFTSHIHIG